MPSDPTVLPNRNNPLRVGYAGGGGCTMRIIGLLFIFVFLMRVWITSVLEYVQLEESYGQWTQTNATVVAFNATRRTYYTREFERTYFCPLLNYETTTGENITAIGNSDCVISMNETSDLVGNSVQVRYDPDNPEEFVEQDEYKSEMKLLTLLIACGVSLSILFTFVLIRTIMTGEGSTNEGEEVSGLERKAREELIRSKFHFQKVSSDKGNMNIANIDSKWEDICEHKEDNGKDKEKVDKQEEIDEESGGTSSSTGPAPDCGTCSSSATPSMTLPSLANTFALNSNLLSSWRRPAGVVTTECVICLEEYKPGDIICTAKTTECNHVFHEKCITSWLLANHDECPLCRVNLLKGSGDDDDHACVQVR